MRGAVATGCNGLLFSGALTGGRAVFAATGLLEITGVFARRTGGSVGLRVRMEATVVGLEILAGEGV